MSIATEQKIETLWKRVDDLECEVTELRGLLRQALDSQKLASVPPFKEATGGRASLSVRK